MSVLVAIICRLLQRRKMMACRKSTPLDESGGIVQDICVRRTVAMASEIESALSTDFTANVTHFRVFLNPKGNGLFKIYSKYYIMCVRATQLIDKH